MASVGMKGNLTAVVVGGDGPVIETSDVFAHKVLHVVSDGEDNLCGMQML